MDFYDANNGVIVGGNVPLNTGTILTTNNSGVTWTVSTPGSSRLIRVDFYDATVGYAVGLNGTILKWSIPVAPDASFSTSSPGCVSQAVSFYTVMAAVTGVTHSWDFGLGATPATSSAVNPPAITYSSTGAKLVKHVKSGPFGQWSFRTAFAMVARPFWPK